VNLLKDRHPVGLLASRWVGFSIWTVLMGRTGFNTMLSVPDPTLILTAVVYLAPLHYSTALLSDQLKLPLRAPVAVCKPKHSKIPV
jgi:hypothetical protein